MIRHIVLFSAKESKDIETMRQALARLADIPHAIRLEVHHNSKRDALSSEADLVLYGEFDSYEALDAYKADPRYQTAIAVVRPLRDMRVAVDYVVD